MKKVKIQTLTPLTRLTSAILMFVSLTVNLYSVENLLNPNNGADITKAPSQYSSSYPYTRLNDLKTDKLWLSRSGNFINNAIFKFDNNFSKKSFNIFKLYNYGNTPSIKEFAILSAKDSNLSQDIGKIGWSRAVSDANLSLSVNFLSWIEGGIYQNTATQYSSNYPASRMNDEDTHNAWLSHSGVFVNNFDYKFDTDWSGNSTSILNTCSRFQVYGSSHLWGLKDFQVEISHDHNNTWIRLPVPGSSGNTNFNYLNEFETGIYQNTATQYSSNYPASRMNDEDTHNAWLSHSGVFVNNFDYKFDTDYDGNADNNITFDRFQVYGSSHLWGLKDFQVEISHDHNNTWIRLPVPGSSGNTNFNYLNEFETGIYQNTATQYSSNYPASRMNDEDTHNAWLSHSGVFVNNFDYKFDTNYDGNADDNITFDRFQVYGSSSSWGLKDFQVFVKHMGDSNWTAISIGGNTTFTAQNVNGLQTFNLENNETNVTDVRFKTINNYGYGSYVGAKEFKILGVNLSPSYTFTAQNVNGLQTFNLENNETNVTDVRFKTINNYGYRSYVGAKEFKFFCKSISGKHTFTALETKNEQKFKFNYQNGSLFRFITFDNYGYEGYLGAREIELYNEGPIASYQFEDCYYNGTPREVKDDIGDYNGTSKNGMTSKYISAYDDMFGRVAKFDGVDDYVELKSFPHISGSRTITAWIKTFDKTKRGQRVFADDEVNQNGNYALSIGDGGAGKARFYIRGLSPVSLDSDSVIENNKWYFVVATFDKNSKEKRVKIYDVNGTLLDSVSKKVSGSISIPKGVASIGGETDKGETSNRFKGYIDKVLIYDKSLSDPDIKQILTNQLDKKQYNGLSIPRYKICPIANYRLDDLCNSGGTSFLVAQSANTGLKGTIKPDGDALVSKKAKVCSGAEFNGINQYIDVNDSDVLDNTQTLTTTTWIYPTELKQTNGTNARGIFSKRNGYSGNSQYAYGVFFWNGHNQTSTKAALYVDIDSQNDRAHSTKKIKVNRWTHITVVFDGRLPENERTKIYIDGVLDSVHKETSSFIPDYSSDFYIGNLYSGTNELKVFKGVMDEVKIYDQALNATDISTLYNNENRGLDYSGISRNCICAVPDKNYKFDAWDIFRNINDRHISTKIANQDFNLTIASLDENGNKYQEFNGTVCATVENNTSKLLFKDQNSSIALFKISKAIKNTKVHISWKKDANENCPLTQENNSTNSTDNFAIRPKKFLLSSISPYYAGDDFNITFKALDGLNNDTNDYNETLNNSFIVESNITKAACYNGTLLLNNFSFANGLKSSVDANYSDVGDVNVTIKEKLGSEFALVDSGDTDESIRLITPFSKIITVKPYELNVTNVKYNTSTNQNWLYMADVNSLSQRVKATIIANDKLHNMVHNFTDICYAQNIQVKTDFNVLNSNSGVMIQYDNNTTKLIADINKTITIAKTSFVTSKADFQYAFNIIRSYKKTYNPITIGLKSVDITSTNLSKIENNASSDKNTTFYYGRVKTKDIDTNKQSVNHSLNLEVYSTLNLSNFHQNSLNWYNMKDDNITRIVNFLPKKDFSMSTTKTGISDINSTQAIQEGVINFTITNSWNKPDSAYIHIKIPLYLWYNRYNYYDDNASSDCGSHPCFKYNYLLNNNLKNIKSGDFSGTSVGADYNASKLTKKGVKVFR